MDSCLWRGVRTLWCGFLTSRANGHSGCSKDTQSKCSGIALHLTVLHLNRLSDDTLSDPSSEHNDDLSNSDNPL